MTRILLIGATGYIGTAVASELLRSGLHTVYGLARTPEKAAQLVAKEIIPVIGSVTDSAAYVSLIKSARIHIVVDCAGANDGSFQVLKDLKQIGIERQKEGGAKLGFVYCSGTWVHGSSFERVSDLDPVGTADAKNPPAKMVAWRPQLERDIVASKDVLNVAIIRPGLVYGRESPIWGAFLGPIFAATQEGTRRESVQLPLDPLARPGLIHVDDVASGFRCAIEKLELVSGTGVYPVFSIVSSSEPMSLIIQSAADIIGFKGEIRLAEEKDNPFSEAMSVSNNDNSSRAKQLLGWEPRRIGIVGSMDIYVKAWLASQATA
ncbi:uncharacterized protein KY384_004207 [Bacidia gigantensis]|uniref:uncharacterized protein n=1 Tax=Bacidia gigantensis TaxID=2732470 RepID=UPI001D05944B|nr:uncharacterized protein KY384_004207 [Bacidia gigantensis]KAG8530850.1 hypothetical protein KY384_004207 [Bacidia gigantensis]